MASGRKVETTSGPSPATSGYAAAWLRASLRLRDGETPFPWQARLLEMFMRGELPRMLDLPTGLGKTAVMAIWLVARACGAKLPRRLVYVVDRRAVVDQASAVAEHLRELAPELGLRELPISTLRGQFVDNRQWLADPGAPAIVVGTVDMVGSRLLFEGYGVRRKMRPFHAGLLGADALLVLDEAHLVPPFEKLIEAISAGGYGPKDAALRTIVPPLRLMALSATGRAAGEPFRLNEADFDDRVVAKRLGATKRLIVRDAVEDRAALVDGLAQEAWALSDRGAKPIRGLIYCNRRGDAQAVATALRKLAGVAPVDVELFVGGRRVHEREQAARWLSERGFIAGSEARATVPAFVVATSAGEVGVDLDADHLIGDVVAWERMIQRLGRVNRRGDGDAAVIIVPLRPDKDTRAAIAKDEDDRDAKEAGLVRLQRLRDDVLAALDELPHAHGAIDASPGAFMRLKERAAKDEVLRTLLVRASTLAPAWPALERRVVETWSMTSLPRHTGRPEVRPWLRGWIDEPAQTSIVWRAHLPVNSEGKAVEVDEFFEAAAPHLRETLEIEVEDAVEWLIERAATIEVAAPDGVAPLRVRDVVAFVVSDREEAPIAITGFRLRALDKDRRDRDLLERQLDDATLVVDARLGGLTDGLLDAVSAMAAEVAGLPFRVRVVGRDDDEASDAWREEQRIAIEVDDEGRGSRWLVVESDVNAMALTENARSMTPSRAQLLAEHQSWAADRARALATQLGLPAEYVELLALAAQLHDEGKRALNWQRAFQAAPGEPSAKTTSRPNQKLLGRYRHELGSLPYAERDPRVVTLDPVLRDLCLHLIAAHHGYARPLITTEGCLDAPPSALVARAQTIALRFTRLEARWGPWGLAWWEALLRAADQQASRDNDMRGADRV